MVIIKIESIKNLFLTLITIALLSTLGCSSCKKEIILDNSLPPITQTGANTLGFILNGQPWTPKGQVGVNTNLTFSYDATFSAGVFNIGAYRIIDNSGTLQKINIFGDAIQSALKIILPSKKIGVIFRNELTPFCYFMTSESTTILNGYIDIKKLDKTARIFSGEFDFTLIKSGCDTVRITQGRFDMKF